MQRRKDKNNRRTKWRDFADWAKRRPLVLRIADQLTRGRGRMRVFDALVQPAPAREPDLDAWSLASISAAWLGHATVLLRVNGLTVLVDPVLGTRVGLGAGLFTLGPARLIRPALRIDQLPPIDLVLITHAHLDHLDRPSLKRIADRNPRASIVCPAGCYDLIGDLNFREAREISWDSRSSHDRAVNARGVCITALPVVHDGARVFSDQHRQSCSFLIETDDSRLLVSGDTAYHENWLDLNVDLAIVNIGAYDPWVGGHATPEQMWSMCQLASARQVMSVHHSTFRLGLEPDREPLQRFLKAAGAEASRIVARNIGDVWTSSNQSALPITVRS
ncbi:MAG TPA: MBL fold metallo-hydrolase [Tepidisphaeraceae bacterium]|nr:MBL fold metallo-hydrolase [Tepidisphaeraceae bacterium]